MILKSCSSLKFWKKLVLISSKLKFNFQSSAWTVEVMRTRFPCPGLQDFLRNLYLKKILKYGWSMGSDAIALKFLERVRPYWLFHVGFEEIGFLKSRIAINSNPWFLAILRAHSNVWEPFKNDEKWFLFHLKSFFSSQDYKVFVTTFWSVENTARLER